MSEQAGDGSLSAWAFRRIDCGYQKVPVLEKGHFGAQSDLGLCYKVWGDGEAALVAYQRALQANLHFQFLPCKIVRLRKNI